MLDGPRWRSLYRTPADSLERVRPVSGNSSVVEHRLAKARVEGSNPFSRSLKPRNSVLLTWWWVAAKNYGSSHLVVGSSEKLFRHTRLGVEACSFGSSY